MTRREEIIDTANKFYKNDEVSTFVVAAQWADRTMIEKVMNWLDSIDMDMRYWNPEEGVLQGQFIDDLLKVMKE